MAQDRKSRLQEFVDWAAAHITGNEKSEAQIFLDRLFQAFGQKGLLEVGSIAELCIHNAKEEDGVCLRGFSPSHPIALVITILKTTVYEN